MPNTNHIRLLLLSVTAVLLTSCQDSVNFLVPESDQKLKVLSELLPDQKVKVEVSSTIPVLAEKEYLDINQEVSVVISDGEGGSKELDFAHKAEEGNMSVFETDYPIIPGRIYNVSVNTPYDDVLDVSANTKVPPPSEFEYIDMEDFVAVKNQFDAKLRSYTYQVRFSIDANEDEPNAARFYHIVPLRREIVIDGPGTNVGTYTDNYFHHQNYIFLEGGHACSTIRTKHGFLVDRAELEEDETILVQFESFEEFNVTTNQHKWLHWELYAVTDQFHSYHKAVSAAVNANSYNIEETVIDRSNVVNGRGLVTGMSMSIDSILIKRN